MQSGCGSTWWMRGTGQLSICFDRHIPTAVEAQATFEYQRLICLSKWSRGQWLIKPQKQLTSYNNNSHLKLFPGRCKVTELWALSKKGVYIFTYLYRQLYSVPICPQMRWYDWVLWLRLMNIISLMYFLLKQYAYFLYTMQKTLTEILPCATNEHISVSWGQELRSVRFKDRIMKYKLYHSKSLGSVWILLKFLKCSPRHHLFV